MKKDRRLKSVIWAAFFFLLTVFTILPGIAPYGKAKPFIMGQPYTFFWWFLCTVLLIVGIIVFELTTWSKWREEDNE